MDCITFMASSLPCLRSMPAQGHGFTAVGGFARAPKNSSVWAPRSRGARVIDPLRTTEHACERRKQVVVAGGNDKETVLRCITAVGRNHCRARALRLRQVARGLKVGGMIAHPAERRFIE